MNDIKKSFHNSKSSKGSSSIPLIRSGINHTNFSRERLLNKKVKEYEDNNYSEEDEIENDYEKKDIISFYRNSKSEKNSRSIRDFKKKKALSTKSVIIIAFISMFLMIYSALTFVFNSATVTIVPRVIEVNANDSFVFSNDQNSEAYQIIEIKKELSKELEKGVAKKISSKAYGNITIYNNYNEIPQKLVKNTRFESSNGKIFRIADSVTVPGKTSVPGSVAVKVTADSIGADYNVPVGRFTIPGFKGSPRYAAFYADSKSAMLGGSNEQSISYSKDSLDTTDMQLKSEIRELVKKDLSSVYKKGFSPVYDPALITYTNNESSISTTADLKYTVYANAKIILLKDDFIAKELSKKYITNYVNQNVTLKDLTNLKLFLATSTSATNTENSINIKVSGGASILMNIDKALISKELVNKTNNQLEFHNTLSKFTEISQATPEIFPFWVKTFPKNPNKIEVIIK